MLMTMVSPTSPSTKLLTHPLSQVAFMSMSIFLKACISFAFISNYEEHDSTNVKLYNLLQGLFEAGREKLDHASQLNFLISILSIMSGSLSNLNTDTVKAWCLRRHNSNLHFCVSVLTPPHPPTFPSRTNTSQI